MIEKCGVATEYFDERAGLHESDGCVSFNQWVKVE